MSLSNDENNSKQWWINFWKNGAFLRISREECLLWSGPWKMDKANGNSEKDSNFDICFKDFFGSEVRTVCSDGSVLRIKTVEFIGQLDLILKEYSTTISKNLFRLTEKLNFESSFREILGKIHRQEIEKAVPIVFAKSTLTPAHGDIASWIRHTLVSDFQLWPYGYWQEDSGIIGATPELLFKLDNDKLKTMALAGTLPREEMSKRPSLLKDPKELHEHNLVVVDLEQQLGKIGSVNKSNTRVLELPRLLHLFTELEVNIRNKSVVEAIKLLHPTSALGVSPRSYGFHWMRNLNEQHDRKQFGAPMVFNIGVNQWLGLVSIRNIQWDQSGCRIGAGCGLVSESQLEHEWSELNYKIQSIFELLGL